MRMPKEIHVTRTVTYHVPSIIQDMNQNNIEWLPQDVNDVLEFIEDWVYEDMSAPPSRHDLVYQDENGNEL